MKPESIVFAVAGAFFGLLVGWMHRDASRPARRVRGRARRRRPAGGACAPAQRRAAGQAPRPLDEAQVQALRAAAEKNPSDATVRVELGNLYFDAERYPEAVTWYQEALKLDPKNADVSTDLGVAYYYMNEPDRALQQFDESLKIDPKHAKTLLNQGIVLAFGKQDLQGGGGVVGQADQGGSGLARSRRGEEGARGPEVGAPGHGRHPVGHAARQVAAFPVRPWASCFASSSCSCW